MDEHKNPAWPFLQNNLQAPLCVSIVIVTFFTHHTCHREKPPSILMMLQVVSARGQHILELSSGILESRTQATFTCVQNKLRSMLMQLKDSIEPLLAVCIILISHDI